MAIPAFLMGIVDVMTGDRWSLLMARFWFPLAVTHELLFPCFDFKPAKIVFFYACSLLWLMVMTGYIKPKKGK